MRIDHEKTLITSQSRQFQLASYFQGIVTLIAESILLEHLCRLSSPRLLAPLNGWFDLHRLYRPDTDLRIQLE